MSGSLVSGRSSLVSQQPWTTVRQENPKWPGRWCQSVTHSTVQKCLSEAPSNQRRSRLTLFIWGATGVFDPPGGFWVLAAAHATSSSAWHCSSVPLQNVLTFPTYICIYIYCEISHGPPINLALCLLQSLCWEAPLKGRTPHFENHAVPQCVCVFLHCALPLPINKAVCVPLCVLFLIR